MFLFTILPCSGGSEKSAEVDSAEAPHFGGVYRRGLGHDPVTLDPAKMSDIYSTTVLQQVVEGLVQFSDNLMIVPCIAKSWKSTRDNLHWVFTLKEGVLFHNGREVTAEDFVYTYTRLLDPGTESRAATLLTSIEGARDFIEGRADRVSGLNATGRYTLEIRLSEPFPPFIAVLAMIDFGVVPREEVEHPEDYFNFHPVGTGPFVFDYWERNREIVLTVNEKYHEGRPYLDQAVFEIFPGVSTDEMFTRFEEGKLEDSLVPAGMREHIEDKYQLLRRPSLAIRLLIMNNKTPPFDDIRVRRAFNYAVNKIEISEKVGGGKLIPASSLIPKGMAGYQPDDTNYPYDPDRSARLLEEAGYPDGKGLPVIQYWSCVKSKGALAEDEELRKYLEAVGIKISLNYQTEWPEFKKIITEGRAPIFKYSWEADIPDPDNILSSLFFSSSPTNRAFYSNPDVDTLIGKAQKESDYAKRISLYAKAQDRIMEDAPVILLNYLSYQRVFQRYVRGFEGKALGNHYFSLKRVWLDNDN